LEFTAKGRHKVVSPLIRLREAMKATCPHCGQKGIELRWHGLGLASFVFPYECQVCHRLAIRRQFSWHMVVATIPTYIAIIAMLLPLPIVVHLALLAAGPILFFVLRAVWVPFVPYSTTQTESQAADPPA